MTTIQHVIPIPEDCVVTSAVEVVSYMDLEGEKRVALRIAGDDSLSGFLGLMEWAKMQLWSDAHDANE